MYAGAYSYGHRPEEFKKSYASGKGKQRKWLPYDQWAVMILDHLPAYITWEQYLKNLERMKQNQPRPDPLGPPRQGCAILPGLRSLRSGGILGYPAELTTPQRRRG